MKSVFFSFEQQIIPIFVGPKEANQILMTMSKDIPMLCIDLDLNDPQAGKKVVEEIKTKYVSKAEPFNKVTTHRSDFNFESYQRKRANEHPSVGEFEDILDQFEPILEKDQFETLQDEIAQFYAEFNSSHFTTAALRLGQTLEFIFYVLANNWNVKVNKSSIKKIERIRKLFDDMENRMIDYLQADQENRPTFRKTIQKQTNEISKEFKQYNIRSG